MESVMDNVDKIFDKVSGMVNGEIPNGKFQIARMYGAYQREKEKLEIYQKYQDYCSMAIQDIIEITKDSAILVVKRRHDLSDTIYYQPMVLSNSETLLCKTLDEAMVMLVCIRNGYTDAFDYMMRLTKR